MAFQVFTKYRQASFLKTKAGKKEKRAMQVNLNRAELDELIKRRVLSNIKYLELLTYDERVETMDTNLLQFCVNSLSELKQLILTAQEQRKIP